MPFLFEKLAVYQKSLSWAATTDDLLGICKLKKTHPLFDQLGRAALSIPLNIAEGNGRWHAKEKRQFFMIARGAVLECVAIVQIFRAKKLVTEELYSRSYSQLEEISRMLTGLIQSIKSD